MFVNGCEDILGARGFPCATSGFGEVLLVTSPLVASACNRWSFSPHVAHERKTSGTQGIECFHMTSRRPYWCPKTMKQRPCCCLKPVPWELNSFLTQTLSFVTINLHICCPREWKHSIERNISWLLPCLIRLRSRGMHWPDSLGRCHKRTRSAWRDK